MSPEEGIRVLLRTGRSTERPLAAYRLGSAEKLLRIQARLPNAVSVTGPIIPAAWGHPNPAPPHGSWAGPIWEALSEGRVTEAKEGLLERQLAHFKAVRELF